MRNYMRGIVALSALCFSSGLAEAENKTFENPMIGTNRLDWCVGLGQRLWRGRGDCLVQDQCL